MLTSDTSLGAKCFAIDVMAAMADPVVFFLGRGGSFGSTSFLVRGLKVAVATASA